MLTREVCARNLAVRRKTGQEDRVTLRLGKHFGRGMRIIGERRAGVSAAPWSK
jgi:hypothetical protein